MREQLVHSHSNKVKKWQRVDVTTALNFHPWWDKKWVRTFPTLRTWFRGQLLQTQNTSADHLLLPLSSLSLSPSETPAWRFWDSSKGWMMRPLAEGWNNVENTWHQIEGKKGKRNPLFHFLVSSALMSLWSSPPWAGLHFWGWRSLGKFLPTWQQTLEIVRWAKENEGMSTNGEALPGPAVKLLPLWSISF